MQLTPAEVIRLGIERGHSADVIAASLEAAGLVQRATEVRCRFCCSAHNIPDGSDTCAICQANRPAMTIDLDQWRLPEK